MSVLVYQFVERRNLSRAMLDPKWVWNAICESEDLTPIGFEMLPKEDLEDAYAKLGKIPGLSYSKSNKTIRIRNKEKFTKEAGEEVDQIYVCCGKWWACFIFSLEDFVSWNDEKSQFRLYNVFECLSKDEVIERYVPKDIDE